VALRAAAPADRARGPRAGLNPETLRTWIRQDQADRGERTDRPTTDEQQQLRELRKRVRELERANEILKAASAYFAQEPGPTRRRS
jgi:transposase